MLFWSHKETGHTAPSLGVSSATMSWGVNPMDTGYSWETLAMCPEGDRCENICSGLFLKCKCAPRVRSRVLPMRIQEEGRSWEKRGRECLWPMLSAGLGRADRCPCPEPCVTPMPLASTPAQAVSPREGRWPRACRPLGKSPGFPPRSLPL